MDNTQGQGSEVARLLRQIGEEYEAARLGLSGLAQGTSQHLFITQKMERMGEYHERLMAFVGEDAIALVVKHLESSLPDITSTSVQ